MERTHADLIFEIDYALRLCLRHRRFYEHLRTVFMFVNLFGTTAAVSSVFAKSPTLVLVAGLILSASSVLDRVIDPARKRAAFVQDYKRYAAVKRNAEGKSVADIVRLLLKAREDDADEIESLRDIAYNDVLKQMGRDEKYLIRLNPWKQLFAAIA